MNGLDFASGVIPHALPPREGGWPVYVDGDGLAYTQSGPAGTSREQARMNVISKIAALRRRFSTSRVEVLLTAPGSHKGHRYAVATVKPYQGQRSSSRRPENWEFLRGLLETGAFDFPVRVAKTVEADDLFAYYAHEAGGEVVIVTQDKDMRMIPAVHCTWDDHLIIDNRRGADVVAYGKQYGTLWFWQQMLMGDAADFIPGLPKWRDGDKLKAVGEVTARKLLADWPGNYLMAVEAAYGSFYGKDARLHMMEQGILLWMRRNPADVFDVANPEYGPLAGIMHATIRDAIQERIKCV